MAGMLDILILTSGSPIRERVFSISAAITIMTSREQRQQLLAIDHLAEQRSTEGADDARCREHQRAGPHHRAATCMGWTD